MGIDDSVETSYLTVVSEAVEDELTRYAEGTLPTEGGALARYRLAHARLVKLDLQWDRVAAQDWGDRRTEYETNYQRMRNVYLTQIRWRGRGD